MKDIYFLNVKGEIITPNDCRYDEARLEWNRAIDKYPVAIVYCSDNEDVKEAILYAREKNIPIRIRNGGHNYEGYSTDNSVIVIDVSKMKNVFIDHINQRITVQGGATNGTIYNKIAPYGYPFAGGTCPTVGVSGYALGGGWGYSARKFGLGCDNLIEVEMINYKGKLIKANCCENPDLFWALRGAGGGNFGVVVSMTFKLPSKVDKVTYIELYYPNITKENQIEFFNTWQNWITNVDNDINLSGGLYNSEQYGKYAYLRGISYKNVEQTKILLAPFYKIGTVEEDLEYLSFHDALSKVGASYPPYQYFKSSGRFVNTTYGLNTIEKILEIVNSKRPIGSYLTQVGVYGLGGKVSEVNQDQTAFYYRDARYILNMQTAFYNNYYRGINNAWFNEKFKTIYDITNGSYVNFPNNTLKCPEYDYYGCHVCDLKAIKDIYDPYNVFTYHQGIN